MVLVLCSDADPVRALSATIRRCAYVLVPVSVLFCKYYEYLGRVFDTWGNASYTGVTVDKNMLGYLLFAFGLYFLSALIGNRGVEQPQAARSRIDVVMDVLFLVMIGWLLAIANSKTATLSLALGAAVLLVIRVAALRRHFWTLAITAMVVVLIADELFSIKSAILEASGRDATFTGRTGLWETVLKEPINPLVGAGYASFWLGERLYRFWAMYPTSPPIQAHNGYLEVYLNLGLIGLCLLGFVLWQGLKTIQKRAAEAMTSATWNDRVLGSFGLTFGVAYLLYNVTEATFQGSNFLFTIFLMLAFHRPRDQAAPARRWSGLRVASRKRPVAGRAHLDRI
jgi:O-antigen ligase